MYRLRASPPRWRSRSVTRCGARLGTLLAAAALALAGCAGVATPPATPADAPAAAAAKPAPPARPAALAVERQWLQAWFDGTPVRIEQRRTRAFSVEVPREFSFDGGRSEIKPPLAALLDKLAQSLQRKAELRVELIAAPVDGPGSAALAQRRASSVRQHLMSRGVSASRLAAPEVASAAAVQLRVGLTAP